MHIRLVRPQDAAALRAIYRPAVECEATSFEEVLPSVAKMRSRIARIVPQWPWLVGEKAGEIIGFAYAQPFRERSAFRYSLECAIYVDPGHQRRGVGRTLYAHLLRLARAQGAHTLFAAITVPNPSSIALHESLGFVRTGTWLKCGYKRGSWWDVELWSHMCEAIPDDPPNWRSLSSFSEAELASMGIYARADAERGLPPGSRPAMNPPE